MHLLIGFLITFIYISNFVRLSGVLGFWDEIFTILLSVLGIVGFIRGGAKINLKSRISQITLALISIVFIGIASNYIFGLQQSFSAIIRDVVGFIKFPIVFVVIYTSNLKIDLKNIMKRWVIPFLKVMLWVITILGIVSLFVDIGLSHHSDMRGGIYPYKFLADHPTSFVITMVLIWCTFIAYEEEFEKKSKYFYYILISINLVLSMRTKAFAFIAVAWYVLSIGKATRRYKAIYWISILIVTYASVYSKLKLYSTFGGSGRFDLYLGCMQLARKYAPIGSGFGTFASHISGRYISKVYSFLKISEIFDVYGNPTTIIGDTGYPYYIGQFGIIGCILIVYIFVILFLVNGYKRLKNYGCMFVLIYILIALTTESTLLNYGVQIGAVLALMLIHREENLAH